MRNSRTRCYLENYPDVFPGMRLLMLEKTNSDISPGLF